MYVCVHGRKQEGDREREIVKERDREKEREQRRDREQERERVANTSGGGYHKGSVALVIPSVHV